MSSPSSAIRIVRCCLVLLLPFVAQACAGSLQVELGPAEDPIATNSQAEVVDPTRPLPPRVRARSGGLGELWWQLAALTEELGTLSLVEKAASPLHRRAQQCLELCGELESTHAGDPELVAPTGPVRPESGEPAGARSTTGPTSPLDPHSTTAMGSEPTPPSEGRLHDIVTRANRAFDLLEEDQKEESNTEGE